EKEKKGSEIAMSPSFELQLPGLLTPPLALPMDPLDIRLQSALDSRKARGILRTVPASPALLNRPSQVDFSSNDYLSLAASPKLRDTVIQKIGSSPRLLGSGGSRLLDGGTLEHALLEERLANFFGSAAALLYTSGFDAN
ncbi:11719_t:CDS:2, partial [Acaulospora colombiana]